MKVLLILVDGMRPDALENLPQVVRLKQKASYTLTARTVYPSMTLPCHISLFHSVDPDRHGTTTNTYAPQVRPINGLFEVLAARKKTCAMFYSWEQLRDVSRPGSMTFSHFCKCAHYGLMQTNAITTDAALKHLTAQTPDFMFLYLHAPDDAGHGYGWMSQTYMDAVADSWQQIERVLAVLPEEYTVLITADHGGHDRTHGADVPEDMTIPLFALGKDFTPGKELGDVSIKDIAPTVAALLDIEPDEQWEGKSLL